MAGSRSAAILFSGCLVAVGWGLGAEVSGTEDVHLQTPYEDLTSVLQEIRDAQAVFLEAVGETSDPDAIGEACDTLGARFEVLTPRLHAAVEAHPELQSQIPESIRGTVDECRTAFQAWDDYMNATILPLANELTENETLHAGFGRLNAAIYYMKYGRMVMTLGRGG